MNELQKNSSKAAVISANDKLKGGAQPMIKESPGDSPGDKLLHVSKLSEPSDTTGGPYSVRTGATAKFPKRLFANRLRHTG